MSQTLYTDVLIVGAGPVGLCLALVLQKSGVRYMLIEKNTIFHTTSRAAVIHAHTLDALKTIDVVESLLDRGLKISKFDMRDRDYDLFSLNFEELIGEYNFLLMLPQDETESILRSKLKELGGEIHLGFSAEEIVQIPRGADVYCSTPNGKVKIQTRFVVGADGMNSVVRSSAGIEFDGAQYEESFILADTKIEGDLERDRVSLFLSPAGLVVTAPLPNGNFRIVATVDNAPEIPTSADIQKILDERGPTFKNKAISVGWSSRFRVHHRLAKKYRHGAFFLVGDAAHVHSPAGGQGMNTGIADAITLGGLLVDVLVNSQVESILDRYEQLRRPAAQEVLKLASRMTKIATVHGRFFRFFRNIMLRTLGNIKSFRGRLSMDLSGQSRAHLSILKKK